MLGNGVYDGIRAGIKAKKLVMVVVMVVVVMVVMVVMVVLVVMVVTFLHLAKARMVIMLPGSPATRKATQQPKPSRSIHSG